MKPYFLTLLTFVLFVGTTSAQFLHTEGKEIVDANGEPFLLKGMGLGGWMLQEGYMLQTASFATAQYQIKEKIEELIGEADTEAFYDAWLANHVTKTDIDSLKSWGFNSVRLPFHYNLFTLSIQEEPVEGQNTWLEKGFILTDSLISWCAQNEMYVVLDMHATPGGQGYDQAISDYNPDLPSIWESVPNRRKAASLWRQIALRYKDEPWVAGYDLINEPNWNLGGNNALRSVYFMMTDSIRSVDQNHMIFIEGNWFANDFTGLTPPWDDNMVYSPHKYWSVNDQASIQWVLDMREEHNVPLYLGETGENSNVWFHDAIELFDEHNIGWAWWPMKKVESIAGPLSWHKSEDYQTLLDYWENGGTTPSASFAKQTLMDLAEGMKIENCVFQKDVIDAMFRQQTTDETLPFNGAQAIPGIIYPEDFDLGKNGFAYYDNEVGNYSVTTGNYTSWNNGWIYRNDGVDLENSEDDTYTNGISIGWIGSGEWMQYEVDVQSAALYDVHVRVAGEGSNGKFHFEADGASITPSTAVPNTGGWQTWQTITVENVLLNPSDQKLRFVCDTEGFNLGGMEFVVAGSSADAPMEYVFAKTISENAVQLDLSKLVDLPLPSSPAGFEIFVNSIAKGITSLTSDVNNSRILIFEVNDEFDASDNIRISYDAATQVAATDGTFLEAFNLRPVQNNISEVIQIPGRVEAEDFFAQSGIQLENTSDVGGGQNIGYLDQGDYIDYYVNVSQAGTYEVSYRTAAESQIGGLELQLIDAVGNATTLHTVEFPATGGWQTWQTTTELAEIPQTGEQQLRILITKPLYNINWLDFDLSVPTTNLSSAYNINIFPNPTTTQVEVQGILKTPASLDFKLTNLLGEVVRTGNTMTSKFINEQVDLSDLSAGNYFLIFSDKGRIVFTERLIKMQY